MSNHPWHHAIHAAHNSEGKSPVLASIVYIVVGLFFAPALIGIPILIYGIYKLVKSFA